MLLLEIETTYFVMIVIIFVSYYFQKVLIFYNGLLDQNFEKKD